jgi:hypothetical protein
MPAARRTHPPPPLTVSQMAAINAVLVARTAGPFAENGRHVPFQRAASDITPF